MKKIIVIWVALAGMLAAGGQTNVLFVGNSYTEVNNLPQMTADIARGQGFDMTWSSNTPGGCTFSQHCSNRSMEMIRAGGWDFVVLQEQSQYPSFPQTQVEAEVFPYASRLVDSVYSASPCAEPMFYMTWGRKNGDASNARFFPVLGTYEGMDSMLYERYMQMAADNDASVCPVGRVWRYVRENHPDIELYQSDGSHPSVAGTYAAACAFYVMFFGGDPDSIVYLPGGVSVRDAERIRGAVREVVFVHRDRWGRPSPRVSLELVESEGYGVSLAAHALYADSLMWDFGDGSADGQWSVDSCRWHEYAAPGNYEVTVVALRHCLTDTARLFVSLADGVGIENQPLSTVDNQLVVFPNPARMRPMVSVLGVGEMEEERITLWAPDGRGYAMRDFADLPAGVYVVCVKHRGLVYRGKMVKINN